MRADPFVPPRERSAPGPLRLLVFLAVAGIAVPLHAQSVLGTIRGTVTDPQGGTVAKAAVLVVDEATGVPRPVETDDQGRFEAANLRPGSYRVEVVTTNFKKFEQTGVVVRTSGVARVDIKLELGALAETVTVSAASLNNIVLESPSVAVGLDSSNCGTSPATAVTYKTS